MDVFSGIDSNSLHFHDFETATRASKEFFRRSMKCPSRPRVTAQLWSPSERGQQGINSKGHRQIPDHESKCPTPAEVPNRSKVAPHKGFRQIQGRRSSLDKVPRNERFFMHHPHEAQKCVRRPKLLIFSRLGGSHGRGGGVWPEMGLFSIAAGPVLIGARQTLKFRGLLQITSFAVHRTLPKCWF